MKIKKLAHKIEKHYAYHGVRIKLKFISKEYRSGQIVFRIDIKPGAKVSLIFERASDIQTALHMRLFQPFRDGLTIYLVVSKNDSMQNSLIQMLKSKMFCLSRCRLPIAIGYNGGQKMIFADLAKMPHAMYAGSTNSGKSMGLICLISSLIVKQPVRKVNLLLFDIGANTLGTFSDIPHLSYPIIKDADTGIYVIKALVEEMERRFGIDKPELRELPAIVCVIDEYVSFINNINSKKQSQALADGISNLLRRGRHVKIHMILSTQDPTQKNMKVDIGNITTRMAFKCAKYHNSITILGEGGAERLPGKGAMLFKSNDYPNPVYLQGAYISEDEVDRLVNYIKNAEHDLSSKFLIPEYDPSKQIVQEVEDFEDSDDLQARTKELADIIIWTLGRDTVSASQIMNRFSMGNRAYDIAEKLFEMGLITEKFVNQPRKVLPQSAEELSETVMQFLQSNGFSSEDVSDAFVNRNGNDIIARDNAM